MYRLTDKERKACEYFGGLETFTDEQAANAVKFCCSVCGCNRDEQEYLLNWYFDGYASDLVHFDGDHGLFWRLFDYCGDSYIIDPDDTDYDEMRDAMLDGDQVTGAVLPTGRLFVTNV